MHISDYIDVALLDKFEFYNYNHALEIITQAFPDEWNEIVDCLRKLNITTDDLREAGGNETKIRKSLMMFFIRMAGEKFEFLGICILSSTQDKQNKGDAFLAFPLKNE